MNIGPLSRKTFACALACLLLAPVRTFARTVDQKKHAARGHLETAERLRDSRESRPGAQRTRKDFRKVIDAYRKVYYTAPSLAKADVAVQAVAELLEDQGRILSDPKSFKDAIGQLVFLRREYPGSKFRAEALFTIGEIYRDDLDDAKQAKATFEDFVKHYPGNSRAQEARKAIAEIDNPSVARSPFKAKAPRRERAGRQKASRPTEEAAKAPVADDTPDAPAQPQHQDVAAVSNDSQPHRIARLTGIRHWSTGDYTRIAIDLEQEVKYQAGRVPHPDRIFFDLYGTKLASDLVGKSFEVDAGFLHKIRVAQFKINMARVVLDVDDVAEYSAFLLPNPYRLIIDIHGKMPPHQVASAKPDNAQPIAEVPGASSTKSQQDSRSVVQDAMQTPAIAKNSSRTAANTSANNSSPSQSDVTVTNIRPNGTKLSDNAASALQRAEDAKDGPLK